MNNIERIYEIKGSKFTGNLFKKVCETYTTKNMTEAKVLAEEKGIQIKEINRLKTSGKGIDLRI